MSKLDDLKARMGKKEANRQPMIDLRKTEKIEVSVAEILEAVDACPCKDHCPVCQAYLKACGKAPNPEAKLIVDKVDLQAVLEGKEVIHECNRCPDTGRNIRTKKLGPVHKSNKPAPKPAEPKK